jgi:hypothetical protein
MDLNHHRRTFNRSYDLGDDMSKKSASVIAAGLVVALLAGVAALSTTFSRTDGAAAKPKHVKPIVRTVHHTRKIHRQAAGGAGGGQVLLVSASQPQAGSASSPSPSSVEDDEVVEPAAETDDDEFEGDDDAWEETGAEPNGESSPTENSDPSDE